MTRITDNLELILFGWVGALRRGDPDRIAARLAADIVWQGLRADLVCANRDEVVGSIRDGGEHRRRVEGVELAAECEGRAGRADPQRHRRRRGLCVVRQARLN